MKKLVVIALGGNSIEKSGKGDVVEAQFRNVRSACNQIVQIIKKGYRVIVTHGNGPQIGNLLIQQKEAEKIIQPQPLDVLVAMTQGQLGYIIQRELQNELTKQKMDVPVISLITQVLVNQGDSAFKNLSKPVGPFYSEMEAQKLAKLKGYVIKEIKPDSNKPYRRVVASPLPSEILESNVLRLLVDSGCIIVACGGGGVPIIKNKVKDEFDGIEAVIDKDLSSEILAETLHANILLILTDVKNVKLNYNKIGEKNLEQISLAEAIKYKDEGHFQTGSMGPKVDACIRFLQWGGEKAVITSLENALDALDGKGGTIFHKYKIPIHIKNE